MVKISDHPRKMFKDSLHWRNDSEEIDVFEAAKYFSGTNEIYPNSSAPLGLKDRQSLMPGELVISLDIPKRTATQTVTKNQSKEKKPKHPTSPGGRIAKILNALFSQRSLKKEKSNTWSAKSLTDDVESLETSLHWRRKRRSSISNLQQEHNPSRSFNSGFSTPPAYFQFPKASSSYKDFRSYSDHKEISPYTFNNNKNQNPSVISIGVFKGKNLKHAKNVICERFHVEDDRYSSQEREFTNFSEADGGADSDSSSDLFDLPFCDRNFYSSGLPVYESTHIKSIKRSTR